MPVVCELWDDVENLASEGFGIDDILVRLKIAERFRGDVKRIVLDRRAVLPARGVSGPAGKGAGPLPAGPVIQRGKL